MKTRAKTTFWNRLWIAAQEVERPNQIHTCSTGNGTNKLNSWNIVSSCCFSSVLCDLSNWQQVICIISFTKSSRTTLSEYLSFAGFTVGSSQLLTPYCCFLWQASDCCHYFPSFTGIVTEWLLSLCPRITSLKFSSCSPCTVPPFELYSGGAVVPTIASVMSWSLILSLRDQSDRHFMAIFGHFCLFSLLS